MQPEKLLHVGPAYLASRLIRCTDEWAMRESDLASSASSQLKIQSLSILRIHQIAVLRSAVTKILYRDFHPVWTPLWSFHEVRCRCDP